MMWTIISGWWTYKTAGIGPMIGEYSLGIVIVAACVALWMFTPAFLSKLFPNIQKTLLWVAALTIAVMVTFTVGVSTGEKRVQAQWDVAKAQSLARGERAHASAVRSVARKPARRVQDGRVDPDFRD